MIIDCFSFFNEINMLKFRLDELKDVVDYFVISESNLTHSGKKKPLYFQENLKLFSEYPIIHVIVDDMPETDDPWVREAHQRASLIYGIATISPRDSASIFVSDVDEIPDTNLIQKIKKDGHENCFCLEQDFYYYNLNCKWKLKWYHAKVLDYKSLKRLGGVQKARITNEGCYNQGGWHFSYFGDKEKIITKIKSFAHQEFNTDYYLDPTRIEKCIKEGIDIYERGYEMDFVPVEKNQYLPKKWKMIQ